MNTFQELDLIEPLQRSLVEQNYIIPTPIQIQTIPSAIEGRDIMGCAQTGTGKTAAFALPILNHLGQTNRKAIPNRPNVLVLAPTRELAIQISESFATYGRHLHLRQALVYGGVSQSSQVRAMNRGSHILIATPGRLLDLMEQRFIHLDHLEVFVLDEADRMLDMGFMPDLKRIISKLPEQRQSMFFSATIPPKIIELSRSLLRKPVRVDITPGIATVDAIEQRVMFMSNSDKHGALQDVLHEKDFVRGIVFTRTKRGANRLAEKLSNGAFNATAIHGNKSQGARQRALEDFRQRRVQILVATDLAARGIDVDGVTHVINFDMPSEPESYVHRIGRTGRAGASGMAYTFCSPEERGDLRAIERLLGQKIPVIGKDLGDEGGAPKTESRGPSRRRFGSSRTVTRAPRKAMPNKARRFDSAAGSGETRKPTKQQSRRKPIRSVGRTRQTT